MIRQPATETVLRPAHGWSVGPYLLMMPAWDGVCRYCGESIRLDESYWDWLFGERYGLWMHLACALAWRPRVFKALGELAGD